MTKIPQTIDVPRYSMQSYLSTNLGLELSDQISIPRVLVRRSHYSQNDIALKEKRQGQWHDLSYKQLLEKIYSYTGQLLKLGIKAHEKAAILLPNSMAWAISDLGNLFASAITVPIYETLSKESIQHILKNSESRLIVVNSWERVAFVQSMQRELPDLQHIVVLDSSRPSQPEIGLWTWNDWLSSGESYWKANRSTVEAAHLTLVRDDIATLIYTSGTTGLPKGVMLTHKNILSNLYGIMAITDYSEDDVLLSILPLSHVFERTIGHFCPLLMGCTIAYAESIEKIGENLAEIRPTVCAAVPRIFEKIYAGVVKQIAQGSPLKRKLFEWAKRVGEQSTRLKRIDLQPGQLQRSRHRPEENFYPPEYEYSSPWLRFQFALANKLVFSKIRAKFGGRIRYFLTGGAALSPEIITFFRSINIHIYEGYGLTETSPIVSFNYGRNFEAGTVGKLLPFVQVKFGEDEEILVKGPNVMAGYYKLPEATKEAIDEEGWFHTGDLGTVTVHNHLKITGRKKDLVITSNGKNVASTPIETALVESTLIASSLVVGNGQKYIGALIFPDFITLQQLAKDLRLSSQLTVAQLCDEPKIVAEYQKIVNEINPKLARYEQIKRFRLVPDELTIENGQLTPTLKVKRNVVEKNYSQLIQDLYKGGDSEG